MSHIYIKTSVINNEAFPDGESVTNNVKNDHMELKASEGDLKPPKCEPKHTAISLSIYFCAHLQVILTQQSIKERKDLRLPFGRVH
eukprot:1147183-Pelagomonas_calceolata.AAC.2